MADQESMMIERIQSALGRVLTDEEKYEVVLWDKGRTLAPHIQTESWQIILDSIKNYVDEAAEALVVLSPGSPTLKEAHAVAYAMKTFYIKFQEDIFRAVNAPTPTVLKRALRNSEVPPESL
jgi:hypothetical protein